MTVYELIHELSKYPPNVEVAIIPQKRKSWQQKNRQNVAYIYGRGLRINTGDGEPMVEICGLPENILGFTK